MVVSQDVIDFLIRYEWIVWAVKAFIIVFALATGFAYTTLYERKVLAWMQVRIGPNRAGPGGFLQPLADGIKLFFKEELIPAQADKIIFLLAPIITVLPAFVILAVVPLAPTVTLCPSADLLRAPTPACYPFVMGMADVNVGLLYILSV
ncbi:MAG: NADH-quinone oxidoreductase subunit H, partial [Chloroflexi bacterium]|nr:NADH-quinone oxidoreductase subunit H [Chloroflexota bacterium]